MYVPYLACLHGDALHTGYNACVRKLRKLKLLADRVAHMHIDIDVLCAG